MEQNTTRWCDVELQEKLRVQEWHLNHFLELVDVSFQSTNLAEIYILVDTQRVGIRQRLGNDLYIIARRSDFGVATIIISISIIIISKGW